MQYDHHRELVPVEDVGAGTDNSIEIACVPVYSSGHRCGRSGEAGGLSPRNIDAHVGGFGQDPGLLISSGGLDEATC
jgi:hypothetical protein